MTVTTLSRASLPVLTDRQQHRLLFAATFMIFLLAVAVRRLGRWMGGLPVGGKSLVAEARDTGHSALALAFMG